MVLFYFRLFILIFGSTFLYLASGAVACSGPASTTSTTFPETCAEVKEQAIDETGGSPSNGTYTLYIDGDESMPWEAYCYNMKKTEPLEYLEVAEADNYSQISDGTNIAQTTFSYFRIDPTNLEIDPLDTRFGDSDFSDFEPMLATEDMNDIPAGWAEFQVPSEYNPTPSGAEAKVSLAGTPFVFSEDIEDNNFFCQVDSTVEQGEFSTGTADVSSDLTTFTLTAITTYSEMGISTREVADCDNLGTGATDFSTAAWPLTYVGL